MWTGVIGVGVWLLEEVGLEDDLDKLLLIDLPVSIPVCLIQHTLHVYTRDCIPALSAEQWCTLL